ncbi:hypothetical protein [Acinetobacter haemolyticus]|uniref:hypothetical protein n=1 Tax=Acinetobacter haemolyticus TaxID=29430 RepID=UPI00094941F4|nr:hypothetical protein [Acinetobacter haemolyticus]APR71769.1 hypothetical protein AHTJS_16420 [Acinetobacter haemolyticus]
MYLVVLRCSDFQRGYNKSSVSAAGDLVQKQIFESIECSGEKKYFVAISPAPVWPKGPLFIKGSKQDDGKFISYLNLPVLRELIFSLCILMSLGKASTVIQYNSYFFTNLVIILFKRILNYKSIIILQDYRIGSLFSKKDLIADKFASKLLKYFDGYVPITNKFVEHFNLDAAKSVVFPGAITVHGIDSLDQIENIVVESFAVYAGALEKHNGVKKLVDQWVNQNIEIPLHIFGRGNLQGYIESLNNKNIIFHGFKSSAEVYSWQVRAKYNFCFRFSDGLDEEFFFPSKFFNLVCYKGQLVVNDFKNLPNDLKPYLLIVEDDLSNLSVVLKITDTNVDQKIDAISKYQWKFPIANVLNRVK